MCVCPAGVVLGLTAHIDEFDPENVSLANSSYMPTQQERPQCTRVFKFGNYGVFQQFPSLEMNQVSQVTTSTSNS